MKFNLDEKNNEISFSLSTQAYRKESIYGASLVFTNRAFVYMAGRGRAAYSVTLRGKAPLRKEELENMAGEFHNELLSQSLRWMVAKHNRKTKEAIEIKALFSSHTPVVAKKRG